MPLVVARELEKAFGERAILRRAAVAIDDGERVGLIGSNGAGKSTLGRILAGLEPPDAGSVARRRDASIAYLPQEPVLESGRTAFEEVQGGLTAWNEARRRHEVVSDALSRGDGDASALLASQLELAGEIERLGGWEQGHHARAMLEHLGIERIDQRVDAMSGGERRRVALARILVSRPSMAILDEPTNHLDAETIEWLEGWLVDEFGGALLLITHDRYVLDRVVTRVLEIDRGEITAFEGNYAAYLELAADRLAHESRVEANRLNVLRRERDWLSRSAPARTTKQKARIQRAGELERTVEAARRTEQSARMGIASRASGQRIVALRDAGKSIAGRVLFEHLDLELRPGERVGVIGRNGTGKTTLLRSILGETSLDAGEVELGARTRTMYFDQQRAGLDDTKTVFENVYQGSDDVPFGDGTVNIHSYLERFLFDGAKQRQVVSALSGGERARLALAKMLRGGANLVLLDEPTNDLDLLTLATLEDMLVNFGGSVMVVTHDRWFLDRVATSILAFEGGGRTVHYAGNFDDAQRQRAIANAARPRAAAAMREPAPAPGTRAERRGLTMAEEKELAALTANIDAAERVVAAIETELNDPTLYTSARGSAVREIQSRRDAACRERDTLMERWEALETKKAGGA